jgi:microcystin degradation protein MlrC
MAECGGRSEIAHAALSFSDRDKLTATVVALTDGNCVGRRGIYAGLRLELGPCAALEVGGVTVVVISHRVQCADPIFFGMRGSKSGGVLGRRQVARAFPRRWSGSGRSGRL